MFPAVIDNRRYKSTGPNHNLSHLKEFNVWRSIRQRCQNTNHPDFKRYGARGIKVYERWDESFLNFYEDMGLSNGLTLERVDNMQGYNKENCIWATRTAQARNTRRNVVITYNGVTATLVEHCGGHGKFYKKVWARMFLYGWSVEEALK